MNNNLLLILEMSIGLMVSYVFYVFFLKGLTLFKLNRFYLIFSALASVIIPLLHFSVSTEAASTLVFNNVLDVVTVSAEGIKQHLIQQISAFQWIMLVYFAGVVFFSVVFILRIVKLWMVSRSGVLLDKNAKVYALSENIAPYSFGKRIYINPSLHKQEDINRILNHERIHVSEWHSFDCLFFELLVVLFWFNPVVFRLRSVAKENHEYLADNGAIANGTEKVQYQALLFNQAVGITALSIPNSFNYSLTKKRIIMITKIKSARINAIRLIAFIPVLALLGLFFACEKTEKTNTNQKIDENKVEVIEKAEVQVQALVVPEEVQKEEVYNIVEVMPVYPGGDDALRRLIATNVVYPTEAREKGIMGKVYIQFTVNKEGKAVGLKVVRGVDPLLDAEAIRVAGLMEKWTPGKEKGENVNVQFTIPINFQLK